MQRYLFLGEVDSIDDTLFLRFLYKTVVGRCLLKIIAQPAISKIAGCFLDSKLSKVIIPYFTKKNKMRFLKISVVSNL